MRPRKCSAYPNPLTPRATVEDLGLVRFPPPEPEAEHSPLHLLRFAHRWLRPRWPGRAWGWCVDLDRQQEDVHDPGQRKVDKRRRPDSEPFRRAAPRDMPESRQVQLNARIGRSELPRVIDSTSKGRPTT